MNIHYLNTELRLIAPYDLRPLVDALEAQGFCTLEVRKIEVGRWTATLQATAGDTEAEATILRMVSAIEALEEIPADLWRGCTLREFDIGYRGDSKSQSSGTALSRTTLGHITRVAAGLNVTLHAKNAPIRPRVRQVQAPARRVVSKAEYAARLGRREVQRWGSLAIAVVVGICAAIGILFTLGMFTGPGSPLGIVTGLWALVAFLAAWKLKVFAEKTMREAQSKLDVVPMTRANIGDLPASHTLVRASQEPPQSQQAELLRATEYSAETPAEELLRASHTNRQED